MMRYRHFILFAAAVLLSVIAEANGVTRVTDWTMKCNGETYEVTVPTTVLNALVKAGVYPDPRSGMNNYEIPDVSEEGSPFKGPFEFSSEVIVPKGGSRSWLRLDGINYRADIYVNGQKVADKEDVVGMFRRFTFDITKYAAPGKKAKIAIMIYQLDHPGKTIPGVQKVPFGGKRGSARETFMDETLKFSGGWDCAPVVRDRNVGITLPVYVYTTGTLTIGDPAITTVLPDGDTTMARVTVKVPVTNTSASAVKAQLKLAVNLYGSSKANLSKSVSVPSGTTEIVFEHTLHNPCLWWPNGAGEHPIYDFDLSLLAGGRVSDTKSVKTGLRQVETTLYERDGEYGRVFIINGRRVFCRGGWLQPDALLDDTPENIEAQARLLEHCGVNLVGSEDMPTMSDEWLESWDRHGLMSWHVFHQCYRMYPGNADQHNPADHELAEACVEDIVLRYRNHPSIVAWFGVNEVLPDEDLYIRTKNAVLRNDTSRPYIPTTSISWDVEKITPYLMEDLPTGTTDDGAPDYNYAPSEYYFAKVNEVYLQMFKNEMGFPSMPNYESLKKFMPTLEKPYDPADAIFPLDSLWAEHGAWDGNNFCYRGYDNAIRTFYTEPLSAYEYVRRGEMVSAEGYRAMIEAANHRMWDITTGVMLWKLNSCWPDVCWQIYDWYLAPTAAYWYMKKALEPVHVQMNADTGIVSIINTTQSARKLHLLAQVVDLNMNEIWKHEQDVNAEADAYAESISIPSFPRATGVYFIRLRIFDEAGSVVSENLYWRYSQHQSYYLLVHSAPVDLETETDFHEEGEDTVMNVTLANSTERLAFFNHLQIKAGGEVINPVEWSDNYVSVFPGESIKVTARFRTACLGGQAPSLDIEK